MNDLNMQQPAKQKPRLFKDLFGFLTSYPRYILLLGVFALGPLLVAVISFFVLTATVTLKEMPRVTGLSVLDAVNILENHGLKADIIPQNSSTYPRYFVTHQDIRAGASVKEGRSVLLYVSSGALSQSFPSFVGENIYKAKALLDKSIPQTKQAFISEVHWVDSDKPFGQIIAQTPEQGNYHEFPIGITLTVSNNSVSRVPNFTNQDFLSVLYKLHVRGVHATIHYSKVADKALDGKVLNQLPKEGAVLNAGDSALLTVGTLNPNPMKSLHFTVPSELDGRVIEMVLEDSRGKRILFEGAVKEGELLFESTTVYGSHTLKIFIKETQTLIFYKEIRL